MTYRPENKRRNKKTSTETYNDIIKVKIASLIVTRALFFCTVREPALHE